MAAQLWVCLNAVTRTCRTKVEMHVEQPVTYYGSGSESNGYVHKPVSCEADKANAHTFSTSRVSTQLHSLPVLPEMQAPIL